MVAAVGETTGVSKMTKTSEADVQKVCCKWLEKAFAAGQKCPPFSDQASEYYSPLFEYDWSVEMEKEITEAAAAKAK